mmetsp:Transcript_31382/g.55194  ORF Transcript_31382/g.55194 Transcript_31382/m.55194 type:complete len:206 (-) Transcript_31382:1759-2376(-)
MFILHDASCRILAVCACHTSDNLFILYDSESILLALHFWNIVVILFVSAEKSLDNFCISMAGKVRSTFVAYVSQILTRSSSKDLSSILSCTQCGDRDNISAASSSVLARDPDINACFKSLSEEGRFNGSMSMHRVRKSENFNDMFVILTSDAMRSGRHLNLLMRSRWSLDVIGCFPIAHARIVRPKAHTSDPYEYGFPSSLSGDM